MYEIIKCNIHSHFDSISVPLVMRNTDDRGHSPQEDKKKKKQPDPSLSNNPDTNANRNVKNRYITLSLYETLLCHLSKLSMQSRKYKQQRPKWVTLLTTGLDFFKVGRRTPVDTR